MLPKNEYAPYFEQYIKLVDIENKSIIENLEDSQTVFDSFMRSFPKEKHELAYAEGKWTIKEVIQHIIDTELIFCYRALCFARNDKTSLPGFDHDLYVKNSNANSKNYFDLLDEMSTFRKNTIQLFKGFNNEALLRIGEASKNKISVRALGYLFSGHQLHHFSIIKERYF